MNEPLDEILKAAFRADDAPSILQRIESRGGKAPRVLLRDLPDDATPVHRPLGGEQQGRYEVVGEIARGGVGVILKGRDIDLGRDVAMKVLHERHAGNAELIERFIEEAQVGGQLQHPGIVPVYELGLREDGRPFFAMKLVKGLTLAHVLAERDDPKEERGRLVESFTKACETMAYAHARGVIHRDLKPSNLMLGNYGEVMVVDWGFAKILGTGGLADEMRATRVTPDVSVIASVRSEGEGSSASVAGSVMGTPAYMPPEQALGEIEQLDERSDVFCLGGILCEILTGKPPYVGERADLLVMAAQARLDDARARIGACDADEELKRICLACLAPVRKDRPKNATELARRLRAYLSGVQDRAREAELEAARAHVRRRLSLALAGVVLAASALWIWNENEEHRRVTAAQSEVESALRQASERLGAASFAEAEASARRAIELARVASIDASGAQALLARVGRERKAAERARTRAEEDRRRRAQLIDARFHLAPEYSPAERDAAFRAALEACGVDLDDPATVERAERKDEVIAAIDAWGERQALLAADGDDRRAALRRADAVEVPEDVAGLPWLTQHLLALRLAEQDDVDEARRVLLEAAAAHPDRPVLLAQAALVENRRTGVGTGRRNAERVLDRLPREALPALEVWRLLRILESGQLREAIRALQEASDEGELPERSARLLANATRDLGANLARQRVPESVALLRRSLDLYPDDVQTHWQLAVAYLNALRDGEGAIPHVQRVLDAKPLDLDANHAMAVAQAHALRYEESVRAGWRAVAAVEGPHAAYGQLGLSLVFTGRIREGLEALDTASRIPELAYRCERQIAQGLLVLGQIETARARAATLYRRHPMRPEAAMLFRSTLRLSADPKLLRDYTMGQIRRVAGILRESPENYEKGQSFGILAADLPEIRTRGELIDFLRQWHADATNRMQACAIAGWSQARAMAEGRASIWKEGLDAAEAIDPDYAWLAEQRSTYRNVVHGEFNSANFNPEVIEQLKANPADYWSRQGLVWSLIRDGRYEAAVDLARSARLPEGLGQSTAMARLVAHAERMKTYAESLRSGTAVEPGPEAGYDEIRDLALTYALAGRWKEAAPHARAALDDPRFPGALPSGAQRKLRDAILREGSAEDVVRFLRAFVRAVRAQTVAWGFHQFGPSNLLLASTLWCEPLRRVRDPAFRDRLTDEQRTEIDASMAELRRLMEIRR